ncbi:MAG: RidA family protein [Rhodospirillaceae bacterium]
MFRSMLVICAAGASVLGCSTLEERHPSISASTRQSLPGTKNYSAAVAADNLVFLSGTLGRGADGKVVEGGIRAETRQAMENLKRNLEKMNLSMRDVVKVNVYITQVEHFGPMSDVYITYFPSDPPARTTVVTGMPDKAGNIEIEMIAVRSR